MKRMLFTLLGTLAMATTALATGVAVGNPQIADGVWTSGGRSGSRGGNPQVADGVEVGNPHGSGGSSGSSGTKLTLADGTVVGNPTRPTGGSGGSSRTEGTEVGNGSPRRG